MKYITSYKLANKLKTKHYILVQKLKEIFRDEKFDRYFKEEKIKKNFKPRHNFYKISYEGCGILMLALDIDFYKKIEILKSFEEENKVEISHDPITNDISNRINRIAEIENKIKELEKELLENVNFINYYSELKYNKYEK